MFLVFLAAENLKNTIPAPPILAPVSGNRVFGVFGCPNLKNAIPSSPVVGRVEQESRFWCF